MTSHVRLVVDGDLNVSLVLFGTIADIVVHSGRFSIV